MTGFFCRYICNQVIVEQRIQIMQLFSTHAIVCDGVDWYPLTKIGFKNIDANAQMVTQQILKPVDRLRMRHVENTYGRMKSTPYIDHVGFPLSVFEEISFLFCFRKALALDPDVLLLDEVMAGLNATEVDDALVLLRRVNERGVTLIVVEHLMKAIVSISTTIVVLAEGKKIAQGAPAEVLASPHVIEAYLGTRWVKRQAELAEINAQRAAAVAQAAPATAPPSAPA